MTNEPKPHPWLAADSGDDTDDVGDPRDMAVPSVGSGMSVRDEAAWAAEVNAAGKADGKQQTGKRMLTLGSYATTAAHMERIIRLGTEPEDAFRCENRPGAAEVLRDHWSWGTRFWAWWQGRQKPEAKPARADVEWSALNQDEPGRCGEERCREPAWWARIGGGRGEWHYCAEHAKRQADLDGHALPSGGWITLDGVAPGFDPGKVVRVGNERVQVLERRTDFAANRTRLRVRREAPEAKRVTTAEMTDRIAERHASPESCPACFAVRQAPGLCGSTPCRHEREMLIVVASQYQIALTPEHAQALVNVGRPRERIGAADAGRGSLEVLWALALITKRECVSASFLMDTKTGDITPMEQPPAAPTKGQVERAVAEATAPRPRWSMSLPADGDLQAFYDAAMREHGRDLGGSAHGDDHGPSYADHAAGIQRITEALIAGRPTGLRPFGIADTDPRPVLRLASGETVRADEVWSDPCGAGCANVDGLPYYCEPGLPWRRTEGAARAWYDAGFASYGSSQRRVYPPPETKPSEGFDDIRNGRPTLAAVMACAEGLRQTLNEATVQRSEASTPCEVASAIRAGDYVRHQTWGWCLVRKLGPHEPWASDCVPVVAPIQHQHVLGVHPTGIVEHRPSPRILLPDGREVAVERMWESTDRFDRGGAYANVEGAAWWYQRSDETWYRAACPDPWLDLHLTTEARRTWPPLDVEPA